VSRISPRKRIELLLDVMERLRDQAAAPPIRLLVIGTTVTQDDQYYEIGLREQVWRRQLQDVVHFAGYVPSTYIPAYYQRAFLHLNVSQTGSMDKTVVEALSSGCPVLTSNEAFSELLKGYPEFVITDDSPAAIMRQVIELHATQDRYNPQVLRSLVVGKHDISTYVKNVLQNLEEISVTS
jgi:glycosyltransferase involved in cell wall biosynthesis